MTIPHQGAGVYISIYFVISITEQFLKSYLMISKRFLLAQSATQNLSENPGFRKIENYFMKTFLTKINILSSKKKSSNFSAYFPISTY